MPALLLFWKKNVVVNMIRFAICEDVPQMAEELSHQLAGYLQERRAADYTLHRFSSGCALLENGGSFDVIFLDIQMQRPDGMQTARLLRQRGDRSLIIFVTVLAELVFDAFQVEAFDYLLKPLDSAHFRRTMDRALLLLEQRAAGALVIRRGSGCELLPFAEILYCEVLGRKVYLHLQDGMLTSYNDRLINLERRVDGRFFKCHRSYLVNLDHIRGCQAGQVMLPRGEAIPVSRLRERELTEALLRRMQERGC